MKQKTLYFAMMCMIAALAFAGCKEKGAGGGDAGGGSAGELVEKAVKAMNAYADAIDKNAGNCDAMGDALEGPSKDLKEMMPQLQAEFKDKKEPPPGAKEASDRLKTVAPKLGPCMTNEKVKAAIQSMAGPQ